MDQMQFADIEIKKSGDIYSPGFKDIYFSSAGGYMESIHVFMEPNHIPARFMKKKKVSVFEAGFGTGLNFLIALKFFSQFAPKDSELEFTSFEKFPITAGDLSEIYRFFIHLPYQSTVFLEKYSKAQLKQGLNTFSFLNGRVLLNLILDDLDKADRYLPENSYDAWFLDGFNPSCNPEMWTDSFFEFMGKKSCPNATFSTFSAAGFIRRTIAEKGFNVHKTKGYNRKREMLSGIKF